MSAGPARVYERASIVLVQLDPVRGSEQSKVRPCVIVSDAATVRRSRAKLLYTVVPLTRSTTLVGPLAPRLKARKGGSTADGVALCMHVRTVDPVRIVGFVGTLNINEMRPLQQGLGILVGPEYQVVPESWRKRVIGELLHSEKTDAEFRSAIGTLYALEIRDDPDDQP